MQPFDDVTPVYCVNGELHRCIFEETFRRQCLDHDAGHADDKVQRINLLFPRHDRKKSAWRPRLSVGRARPASRAESHDFQAASLQVLEQSAGKVMAWLFAQGGCNDAIL